MEKYYYYRMDGKSRCFGGGNELYAEYHDTEWGVAVHDDLRLFEMLILEGAQAGLSWETILKRREGYREAFCHFDPEKVASMSDSELKALCYNEKIIRNRLKIYAARQNARVFLKIQTEFGSFDRYLWGFKGDHHALSKELKKKGMTFVGPTIVEAYMQAVGFINGHKPGCWKYCGSITNGCSV